MHAPLHLIVSMSESHISPLNIVLLCGVNRLYGISLESVGLLHRHFVPAKENDMHYVQFKSANVSMVRRNSHKLNQWSQFLLKH